jgi:hypothetical protein
MIAATVIICIVAYIVIGIVVGRGIYNINLLKEYTRRLKLLQHETDHMKKWNLEYHRKGTLEEVALDEVYKFTMTREEATFNGIFWPFAGLWYFLYLKAKQSNFHIMPKNVVEKQIALQKDKNESDRKYKAALQILKDAGIEETSGKIWY